MTVVIGEAAAGIALSEPVLVVGCLLTAAFGLVLFVVARLAARGDHRADAVFGVGVASLAVASSTLLPRAASAAALLPVLGIVPLLPGGSRRRDLLVLVAAFGLAVGTLLLGQLPQPIPPLRPPLDDIFASAPLLGVAFLIVFALHDLSRSMRESLATTAVALRRQQAIFDGALEPMLLVHDERTFIDANRAAAELLGVPRHEIVGRKVADFYRARGTEPGGGAASSSGARGGSAWSFDAPTARSGSSTRPRVPTSFPVSTSPSGMTSRARCATSKSDEPC